jgi:hypothetical protein
MPSGPGNATESAASLPLARFSDPNKHPDSAIAYPSRPCPLESLGRRSRSFHV